jgi:hypothetical protein
VTFLLFLLFSRRLILSEQFPRARASRERPVVRPQALGGAEAKSRTRGGVPGALWPAHWVTEIGIERRQRGAP